jgi:hypothetical protein
MRTQPCSLTQPHCLHIKRLVVKEGLGEPNINFKSFQQILVKDIKEHKITKHRELLNFNWLKFWKRVKVDRFILVGG